MSQLEQAKEQVRWMTKKDRKEFIKWIDEWYSGEDDE